MAGNPASTARWSEVPPRGASAKQPSASHRPSLVARKQETIDSFRPLSTSPPCMRHFELNSFIEIPGHWLLFPWPAQRWRNVRLIREDWTIRKDRVECLRLRRLRSKMPDVFGK